MPTRSVWLAAAAVILMTVSVASAEDAGCVRPSHGMVVQGRVELCSGVYRLENARGQAAITLKSGARLECAKETVIDCVSDLGHGISAREASDVRIVGCTVRNALFGIQLEKCTNASVENNRLESMGNAAEDGVGILVTESDNFRLTGNAVAGCGHAGIITMRSQNGILSRNTIENSLCGTTIRDGSGQITVEDGTYTGNRLWGVYLLDSSETGKGAPSVVTIRGCLFRGNRLGVGIQEGRNVLVEKNRLQENETGLATHGPNASKILLKANQVTRSAERGIHINSPEAAVVYNEILRSAGPGLEMSAEAIDCHAEANTIRLGKGDGMLIRGRRILAADNRVEANAGAGIALTGESSLCTVGNNRIEANGASGIEADGDIHYIGGNLIQGNAKYGILARCPLVLSLPPNQSLANALGEIFSPDSR